MTRQPTPTNILDAVLTTDATGPDRTALRARLRWDYSQVVPVDRKAVEDAAVDILANGQRMQQSAVAIGERLIAVKRLLEHGQFSDWCSQEFNMSVRTAQNLMNVAREFSGKSETVSLLTDSAMYMLAAPSTPEPARAQAIAEAQHTGKSPTKERVREIIAEHRPQPSTPRQFAAAVKSATWNGTQPDILPPTNAPLPQWVGEPISNPGQSTADYLVYRSQAAANGEAYLNLKEWRQWLDNGAPVINDDDDLAPRPSPLAPPDERLQPAQRLRALYQAVIDSDDEYGQLTGRFSDTLAVKRDLSAMIGHLDFLINAITHPEEVSAAD